MSYEGGGEKKMKKILILIPIILLVLALVGCIPGITPTPEPEPEPIMEAVALAKLDDAGGTILWSIINVGDVFIREYTLTFKVVYPNVVVKDYFAIEMTGTYLEVGKMHSGEIDITVIAYDTPESVSVTWELSE